MPLHRLHPSNNMNFAIDITLVAHSFSQYHPLSFLFGGVISKYIYYPLINSCLMIPSSMILGFQTLNEYYYIDQLATTAALCVFTLKAVTSWSYLSIFLKGVIYSIHTCVMAKLANISSDDCLGVFSLRNVFGIFIGLPDIMEGVCFENRKIINQYSETFASTAFVITNLVLSVFGNFNPIIGNTIAHIAAACFKLLANYCLVTYMPAHVQLEAI